MNTKTFESALGRISGDIDQVTVQKIFKKLATGNKKRDDALWELTSEAAREIRQLVKGDILTAHTTTLEAAKREALEAVQIYTDPNRQKMSPYVRLKEADREIRRQLAQLDHSSEGNPSE